MITLPIKYTDYNDVERTEEFSFNLNKAELAELQLGVSGGFDAVLKRLTNRMETPEVLKIFKGIILKAYGVKSDDGRRFMKSEELSKEFEETEAFSNLYMSFFENADNFTKFIKGILPKDLSNQITNEKINAITTNA